MAEIKILCLIPARYGSKGIPNKNIKMFGDKPLLAWSIEQAKKSKYADKMRIIVSTDSEEYKKIAKSYGAEVPFLRPKKISQDLSNDYDFIKHAIDWLKKNESYNPDLILQLRPTQPCRKVEIINNCLEMFIKNIDTYDSLRTVVPFEKSPYKMYSIQKSNLTPLFTTFNNGYENIIEPFNQARQILPQCYLHNGYVDITKANIVENGKISGERIFPFIMEKNETIDIDTEDDWKNAVKNKLINQ